MQFDRLKRKRLGDILVDEGLVAKEHVIEALQQHQKTKRLVSDILIDGGQLAEFDLAKALVGQQQLPFIDLANYTIHKDLVGEFDGNLLHRGAVVPLERFGTQVVFACQELPAGDIAEELRERVPDGCYFFVALSCEIRRVLRDHAPVERAPEKEKGKARTAEKARTPEKTRASEKGRAHEKPARAEPVAAVRGIPDQSENSAWKELFDAANAAVMADLKPEAATED